VNKAIIVPTYNEEEGIEKLISEISKNVKDADIFIIDDSINNKIEEIVKKFKNINYFYRGQKLGRGSAVLFGFNEALKKKKYDLLIEMDADLSHDPSEINNNLKKLKEKNLDLLISSRYMSKSLIINWSFRRKIFSRCSNILANYLLEVPVKDYTNGFRIYSVEASNFIIHNCGKVSGGFVMLSEILLKLHLNGFIIGETNTIFRNRTRGESSVTLKEILNALLGIIKLYLIKKNFKKYN
jgi:dolichol-phosphate mannosyltransferase